MSGFAAYCPIANLGTVRQLLDTQGFGPSNFSVPLYTGPGATHAGLHAWGGPDFRQALVDLAHLGVTVHDNVQTEGESPVSMEPTESFTTMATTAGAQWGADADELPSSGTVTAGTIYRLEDDLWYVIQSFDRSTFGAHPSTYPALLRRVRNPYAVEEWKQPLDQFDAYKLVNPFTGRPDEAYIGDTLYYVTQGDGAGLNVWNPTAFGWAVGPYVPPVEGEEPEPEPEPEIAEWAAGTTYATGDQVTYQGTTYTCLQGHTAIVGWHPPAVPALWNPA